MDMPDVPSSEQGSEYGCVPALLVLLLVVVVVGTALIFVMRSALS